MLTLGELKHLERVCVIARKGTMKMYAQAVISLFEKVTKLNKLCSQVIDLFVWLFFFYKLWTHGKDCKKNA